MTQTGYLADWWGGREEWEVEEEGEEGEEEQEEEQGTLVEEPGFLATLLSTLALFITSIVPDTAA